MGPALHSTCGYGAGSPNSFSRYRYASTKSSQHMKTHSHKPSQCSSIHGLVDQTHSHPPLLLLPPTNAAAAAAVATAAAAAAAVGTAAASPRCCSTTTPSWDHQAPRCGGSWTAHRRPSQPLHPQAPAAAEGGRAQTKTASCCGRGAPPALSPPRLPDGCRLAAGAAAAAAGAAPLHPPPPPPRSAAALGPPSCC